MQRIGLLVLSVLMAFAVQVEAGSPRVVVSLAPLQALAEAVMQGVAEPVVLLPGGASPHSYALKPSQMRELQQADLVFWIGPALETFLARPLATLPANVQVVPLAELPGLRRLPIRSGGVWATDGEDTAHGHDHDQAGAFDPHLWLGPSRGVLLAGEICRRLSAVDPQHAERYRANLRKLTGQVAALRTRLESQLAPLRGRPYLVFHDAYRYFEEEFGLQPLGAVSISPERAPGARRLRELQEQIRAQRVQCLFREPQFPPRLVEVLTAGTGARTGVLDPLGAELAPGADAYLRLLQGLADGLRDCLN